MPKAKSPATAIKRVPRPHARKGRNETLGVRFTPEQAAAIRKLSLPLGLSDSTIIGWAVDLYLIQVKANKGKPVLP